MSSVNRVILVGRLGRDPETRYTGDGQAVTNFSLATDESFKNRAGEKQKRTEWHRVTLWGKQAETAQQYLHKGSMVYVEGKIQTKEYEKDGQKKQSLEIVAQSFRMLDKLEGSQASESSRPQESQEITDDDIPF